MPPFDNKKSLNPLQTLDLQEIQRFSLMPQTGYPIHINRYKHCKNI
nr:MAG TPA: hypothetical protein [Caudoviricetes sp.]